MIRFDPFLIRLIRIIQDSAYFILAGKIHNLGLSGLITRISPFFFQLVLFSLFISVAVECVLIIGALPPPPLSDRNVKNEMIFEKKYDYVLGKPDLFRM